MKNKRIGKCHLCGQIKELTFEHIPPEKAHNNMPARMITGETLIAHISGVKMPWELSGEKYKNMQRGMDGFTLCRECNNKTGTWYANDYIKFANSIGYVLNNKVTKDDTKSIYVELKEMYPLRIIKQILCMFVSTMHPDFLDSDVRLREFILNKESQKFDVTKYRISMYSLKNRRSGWSGLNAVAYSDGSTSLAAYMDLYPLGFIFEIEPNGEKYKDAIDITQLATMYDYNFKGNMQIYLNVLERNGIFVGDFRSKEEILNGIKKNKENTINSNFP